jgi:hypothetical protein
MGYNTYYKISVDDDQLDNYVGEINAVSKYDLTRGESITWYDWQNDMQAVSKKFPDVVFRVDGEGEEAGDIWVAWFKNGKVKKWRLVVSTPKGFNPPGGW